ncbi:MAG TPA: SpoIIE family protein phosphatase [Actinomycetota bacterium]|jgi:serine phosphatase RsbU (regulator of sigma subunit)/anti-sigma regulatory factor (Ser/Thr protein kinase)
MATSRNARRFALRRGGSRAYGATDAGTAGPQPPAVAVAPVDIEPNDPLVGYFQHAGGAVDLEGLALDSPALRALRSGGMRLVVPLVSQGELIGLLNLGPRRSEQEYSADDRKLLDDLAAHAAPAVRVAQLVREQQAEIRERERIEQELKVAQLIQQQFLPHALPELPGWHVAALYRPARAVGGDFYDFIELPGGLVAIVVGDVTDKGVPAALVMATTHSILRAEAARLVAPAEVLERANDLLVAEMPAHMFVTCLYAVLDPASGELRYANAGHNLPYLRTAGGVSELRATGMPLGLMPGMRYDEKRATLAAGDGLLLHSDGLAEAHAPGPEREMFGFPRLAKLVGERDGGEALIDLLLEELARFTGPGWEQEDDVTLVTVQRTAGAAEVLGEAERVLAEFEVASRPGNEREAISGVVRAVEPLGLPAARLQRLETAVGEAAMNAIEHGNQNRPELPVTVRVAATGRELSVRITDQGGDRPLPQDGAPDLEAKLQGLQGPRGWGLFLIRNMVDELRTFRGELGHGVELIMRLPAGEPEEES